MYVLFIFIGILLLFPFVVMAIRKDFSDFTDLFVWKKNTDGWVDIAKMIADTDETELQIESKEYLKKISTWLLNIIFIGVLGLVFFHYAMQLYIFIRDSFFPAIHFKFNWSELGTYFYIIKFLLAFLAIVSGTIVIFIKVLLFIFKFSNVVDIAKLYFVVEFINLFIVFSRTDQEYKGPIVKELVYKVFNLEDVSDKSQK